MTQEIIQRRMTKIAADLDQAFINMEVQKVYIESLTATPTECQFYKEALVKAAQRADYYERKISALNEEKERLSYATSKN